MAYTVKEMWASSTNYGSQRSTGDIKYIVIHYTGNDGDTAVNNGKYFQGANRKASAHYFVDDSTVVHSVPDNRIAWSVGGSKYNNNGGRLYGVAKNANTLNIELCDDYRNGSVKATDATINNALTLTRELMKKYNVPQWYIDSCKKIKYMFPKAHAVAYVLSAIRVAWWKLYYPREYYAVYFSTRCDFFDIDTLVAGKDAILARRKEIEMLRENRQSSNKDEGLWDVFEIALEMIDRGFHFSPLNLEKSDASNFILDPDDPSGLLPPFSSVDSLGESVAKTVIEARERGPFLSKEDVIKRTKLNNSHIKQLTKMGVFNGMQEENQLSLF